jgi:hypothetical protein
MSSPSGIRESDVPSTAPRAWALCRIQAPHIFWRAGGKLPILYTSEGAAKRAMATIGDRFPNMERHYSPVQVAIVVVQGDG